MRTFRLFLAAMVVAGWAGAQQPPLRTDSVTYERDWGWIVVHWDGESYRPAAITVQNGGPAFHITAEEIYALGWDVEETQTRHNIWTFEENFLRLQADHRATGQLWAWGDDSIRQGLGRLVWELQHARRKLPVGLEVEELRRALDRKARMLEMRRKCLEDLEEFKPGSLKDPGQLAAVESRIAAAEMSLRSHEDPASMLEGPAAKVARNAFLIRKRLDKAAKELEQAGVVLDWLVKE